MAATIYEINVAGNSITQLRRIETQAGKANLRMRNLQQTAQTGFIGMNRGLNNTNSLLRRTATLITGVSLAMGAFSTIRTGAGFEQSMSNVQALTDASSTKMIELTDTAREAGKVTVHTARASAEGMGFLAMAGQNANEIMASLGGTLNLASSGMIEVSQAADISTNIVAQYGKTAGNTLETVDQLAFVQSRFNTNILEAAEAYKYFGPTAHALNVQMAESGAVIGVLANRGLKGSFATRVLQTSLTRLTNPTKKMSEALGGVVNEMFNAQGKFIGMAGVVELLNSRMDGFTDKERGKAISTIFSPESFRVWNILLSEGATNIRKYTAEVDAAAGSSERMARIKMDNLIGDFRMLSSASQESAISIFTQTSPALRLLTMDARDFMRNLDTTAAGTMLTNLTLSLRTTGQWLVEHASFIKNIAKAYILWKGAVFAYRLAASGQLLYIRSMVTLMPSYAAGVKTATVAQVGLNTAMRLSPWGMALAGVTALVGAMVLFSGKTEDAAVQQERLNTELQLRRAGEERKTLGERAKLSLAQLEQEDLSPEIAKTRRQEAKGAINRIKEAFAVRSAFLKTNEEIKGLMLQYRIAESTALSTIAKAGEVTPEERTLLLAQATALKTRIGARIAKETGGVLQTIAGKEMMETLKLYEDILNKTKDLEVGGVGDVDLSKKTTEQIIQGGRAQRIINISLGKFFDNIVFNLEGYSEEEVREHLPSIETQVQSVMLRVLNSANAAV